jgi:hypothetical protein
LPALDRGPPPAFQDGSAVLIMPGGGYGFLSIDNEGEEQARWLTERGVTCFILYYRLPGEGWRNRQTVPLQDAQRAMRLIRSRAGISASIRRASRCWAFRRAAIWRAASPRALPKPPMSPSMPRTACRPGPIWWA